MGTTAAQMQKRQQPPEGGPLGQEDPASREPAANLVPSATNHSFTTSFQPLRTRGDSAPTARCYGWGPSRPVPVNHTPVRSSLSSCFAPISKPCAGYVYCHELQAGSGESCTENFVNFSFPWLHAPPPHLTSPNARRSGLLPTQCDHRYSDLLTDPPSPPRAAPRPASPGARLWSTE